MLVVEEKFREGASQFSFADSGGPRKMKEPMGRLGSLRPARERRMALATRPSRILADDARRRRSSMVTSFFTSPSSIFRHGNARPFGDDAGDVLRVDLLSACASAALALLVTQLGEFLFGLANQAIADFGDALHVSFAFFGLPSTFNFSICFSGRGRGRSDLFLFSTSALSVLDFSRISASSFSMTARRSLEFASSSFFESLSFDFGLDGLSLQLIDVVGSESI